MQELTEGVDFYYNEEGLFTFLPGYLLKRGYCCGSGCKHCPYNYQSVPEPARSCFLKRRKDENSNDANAQKET